jgi:hypothetical protein
MSIRPSSAFLFVGGLVVSLWCSQLAFGATAPCELLTQNQVSTAIRASAGPGSPIANTGCSWKASQVTVTVSIQNEKMFGGAKRNPAPGMTRMSVSGVGDEAIFIGAEKFSSLWVRKGTTYLLVRIYGVPMSDAQTELKTLASTAVSKL